MFRSAENRILRDASRLVGLQITNVRYMTDQECAELSIQHRAMLLTLNDGTVLYAMTDDEGNDAGVLMTRSKDGQQTHFSALPRRESRRLAPQG